jgi:hypothetical protein
VRPDRLGLSKVGRRAAAGLVLEIDVGERLPVGVAAMKQASVFSTGPGRREAAAQVLLGSMPARSQIADLVAVIAKRRGSATLNAHNDQDPTGEAGSQVAFR